MSTLDNLIDQALDVRGSDEHVATMPWEEENGFLGQALSGQSGAAASIVAGAPGGQMRVQGLTGMGTVPPVSKGNFLTISGSGNPGNNGTFIIYDVINATTVDVVNASAVIPDAGPLNWVERQAYSLSDDLNYARTDRAAIKGVAYYEDVPYFERPSAIGTPVPVNLNNIKNKTADALATVRNVYNEGVKLPPSITDGDATLAIADETFVTTGFHFTADDVNSFITISGSTDADGTYRIKAVTDGQTLELDGLNSATAEGSISWVREGDLKGILTSRGWADAVDRTGVPIADSGAEDETYWDATFIEVLETQAGGEKSTVQDEAAARVWGRSFGDEKDPNATATNEGSRLFMQLKTGDNDGSASDSAIEPISGRSGSAASITGGNKNVTGLANMVNEDVGLYLTLWNLANDEAGHYKITSVVSSTEVVVERAAGNFTADASGAVNWQVSRHSGNLYTAHPDRFRNDELSETWSRTVLIGGSGGTSELVIDIDQIRDVLGVQDGDTDLSSYLTNTGNYFPFSDLPDATPQVTESLNTLNAQIGDRDYIDPGLTNVGLTKGETITASIQKLADAIAASNIVRYIEELAASVLPGALHTLPGGATYTPSSPAGKNLWWYSRGLLRHPGSNPSKHEYDEVAGAPQTQILINRSLNSSDILDYFILQ